MNVELTLQSATPGCLRVGGHISSRCVDGSWSRVQGRQGVKGDKGVKGVEGVEDVRIVTEFASAIESVQIKAR